MDSKEMGHSRAHHALLLIGLGKISEGVSSVVVYKSTAQAIALTLTLLNFNFEDI